MTIDVTREELTELLIAVATSRNETIDKLQNAHMLWNDNGIKDRLTKHVLELEALREKLRDAFKQNTTP